MSICHTVTVSRLVQTLTCVIDTESCAPCPDFDQPVPPPPPPPPLSAPSPSPSQRAPHYSIKLSSLTLRPSSRAPFRTTVRKHCVTYASPPLVTGVTSPRFPCVESEGRSRVWFGWFSGQSDRWIGVETNGFGLWISLEDQILTCQDQAMSSFFYIV